MWVKRKWFIPLSKLTYSQEMIDAAINVLQRGVITTSDEGEDFIMFEKEFATAFGKNYGVCLASGTAALHLTLIACGVEEGDK